MKATTIKIEGHLLEELNKSKPPSKSVSSYVRDILESDIRRRKVAEAAAEYRAFVASHPEEEEALAEWDKADLSNPPRKKTGKS
jgi:hypothetical protein